MCVKKIAIASLYKPEVLDFSGHENKKENYWLGLNIKFVLKKLAIASFYKPEVLDISGHENAKKSHG